MSHYLNSLHRMHWLFALDTLTEERESYHNSIVSGIIKKRKMEASIQNRSRINTDGSETPEQSNGNPSISTPPLSQESNGNVSEIDSILVTKEEIGKYPTVNEEFVILSETMSKVFEFCCSIPDIYSTIPSIPFYAVAYLKRFFIKHSILQYNPTLVTAASIMLAIKADEYKPIEVNKLAEMMDVEANDILTYEQIILYVLDYEILVHTPLRTLDLLYGIANHVTQNSDLKDTMRYSVSSKSILEEVAIEIKRIYSTSLDLLYHPGELALYAYSRVLGRTEHGQVLFDRILESMEKQDGLLEGFEENAIRKEVVKKRLVQISEADEAFVAYVNECNIKKTKAKWRHYREYDREIHSKKRNHDTLSTAGNDAISLASETTTYMDSVPSSKMAREEGNWMYLLMILKTM